MESRTKPDQVVRAFWDALNSGDIAGARAFLHPELEWRVMGRTHSIARAYTGPDGYVAELLALLGGAFVPGTISAEVTVHACGDTVVSEVHESATVHNGRRLVIDLATVMEVREGLIHRCREYLDLAEVAAALPDAAD